MHSEVLELQIVWPALTRGSMNLLIQVTKVVQRELDHLNIVASMPAVLPPHTWHGWMEKQTISPLKEVSEVITIVYYC